MTVPYSGPIIDAHHHFWDLRDGHYPWLQDEYNESFFLGDYHRLQRDYLPPEYRRDTAGFDIVADVHIEAERSRSEQPAELAFLTDLHERTGMPSVIVGWAGFTRPDRDELLDELAANPLLRGIRSKPRTADSAAGVAEMVGQPGTLLDPQWYSGLSALEARRLSWDMRVPAWHLDEAAKVLELFPGLDVIVNHCGLPLDRSPAGLAAWREGLFRLAANPRVLIKVSELGLRNGRWDEESNGTVVRDVVSIFGWNRVMFASNLPVASLATDFTGVVSTIVRALNGASVDELHRLFFANAARAYRIALETPVPPIVDPQSTEFVG